MINGWQPSHEQMTRISMLNDIACASLLVAALALAGCTDTTLRGVNPNAEKQLPQKILAEMKAKGMTRSSPVMARIFKEEGKLEIWKQTNNGRYDLIAELRHLQMVGPARAEIHRGRPPGAGRVLYGPARANEPMVELSPGLQHRLPQRL